MYALVLNYIKLDMFSTVEIQIILALITAVIYMYK